MSLTLKNANVLVIGDIMLDRYWEGATRRISPEAPVPVIHVDKIQERAGGAGNVALNIAALSGKAYLCGCVGRDEAALSLKNKLKEQQIETHFVETGLPTITKLRVLSQNQQLIRMDFEEGFHEVDKSELLHQAEACIDSVGAIILSDYGKGTLSNPQEIIQLARNHQVRILVDPKGNDFQRYHGATMITPNMKEFEAVVGRCHSEHDIKVKALALIEKLELEALLVTRSEKGMMIIHHSGKAHSIPTHAKEVYDVTGAGDTVIAVMGMALSVGYSYQEAMKFANTAAGVVVGKLGTATLTLPELYQALHVSSEIQFGVLSEADIKVAMHQARLQGEKVVFTNGCFDILHQGHVDYLKEAKALGDRLIVGVNTDDSVKALKGPSRPIVPLAERMALLSALACVDWVVPFKEDTPERLITELTPDVLVKGADYEIHEIAGNEHVLNHGGEVKTICLTEGLSTSNIINKIKSEGL
ncbi:bifunctional D-glycero-beta-D-manno-heptose-7-phosphate kinase/D-glycero-beta-D-manno-heptose 1-phosphate adenylyltransferase HldE [Thiotrichales bacterium 19S3-7]|nr:bifunctional D-glycero-beta-D-manno-heptose-7-phosphate kinase/D-glycero-beta-D-manno-heptose 1-phosphate adenylyltransferase HldE [Thiotrichales bacterium 19S3-7]MCF6801209.1 bifunctional D-glycero-beta-D-manno-heptose-7-phosphate kinase/D-glycero-beta-D-manno-heptose 1-phosphate adenylyltransferase HldE [Thiotrichales bacterium 19S3-11]